MVHLNYCNFEPDFHNISSFQISMLENGIGSRYQEEKMKIPSKDCENIERQDRWRFSRGQKLCVLDWYYDNSHCSRCLIGRRVQTTFYISDPRRVQLLQRCHFDSQGRLQSRLTEQIRMVLTMIKLMIMNCKLQNEWSWVFWSEPVLTKLLY